MGLGPKRQKKEKRLSSAEAFRRAAALERGELPPDGDAPEEEVRWEEPGQTPPARQQELPAAKSKRRGKNKKEKKQPQSDMPRIEQIRRRKHERRLRRAALALAVLVAVFLYLGGVFSASVNLFSDLLDSARIALTPGGGWPVGMGVEGLLYAEPLSGGLVLCGKSELVLYSPTARQLRSVQHGYAEPALAVGNARVCVYNRSGKELRVESRSRTLTTKSTEYPILTVGMAPGGTMAVATRSERYLAELTVYDPNFEEVYYAYLAEYYPLSIAIASDNKRMAVSCMKVENGVFGTQLQLYDMSKSAEEARVTVDVPDSVPLQLHYTSDGALVVIYDGFAAVYDPATGQQTARYDYGGSSLLTADFHGRNTLLVFGEAGRASAGSCVLLGETMQVLATVSPGIDVRDAALDAEHFYLLGAKTAVGYDLTGAEVCREALPAEGMRMVCGKAPLAVTAKEILQLIPLKNK